MAKLNDEVKLYIIQQLAMYQTPQVVADLVNQTFSIEVSRQQVYRYHPEQDRISQKFRIIFDTTRANFIRRVCDVPIAHLAYRLTQLQEALDIERERPQRNTRLIMDILREAAKQVGGMYNRGLPELPASRNSFQTWDDY